MTVYMVVRMRATRSHTKNRRSHHALKDKKLTVDKETGVPHLSHRMCMTTGRYKGRKVIDVVSGSVKSVNKKEEAPKKEEK